MCVCVYIYIYIYIYIYTHTRAHTHSIHTHTHTHEHVCVCVCVCVLYEEYECFSFLSLWDCFSNRGEGSLHLPVKASAPSSNKYENISFLLSLCLFLPVCSSRSFSRWASAFSSLTHPSFSRNISSTVTIASLLPLCYWYNYLLTQLLAVTVTIPAKEKTISLFKRGLGHFSAGQTERSSFQPA